MVQTLEVFPIADRSMSFNIFLAPDAPNFLYSFIENLYPGLPLHSIRTFTIIHPRRDPEERPVWLPVLKGLVNVELLDVFPSRQPSHIHDLGQLERRETGHIRFPDLLHVADRDCSPGVQLQGSHLLLPRLKRIRLRSVRFRGVGDSERRDYAFVKRLCVILKAREEHGSKIEELIVERGKNMDKTDIEILESAVKVSWDGHVEFEEGD